MPDSVNSTVETGSTVDSYSYLIPLLTNGYFITCSILVITCCACFGFSVPFLSSHLFKSGLVNQGGIVIGLIFISFGFSFCLSSLFWGQISSRIRCSRSLLTFGTISGI